VKYDNDTVRNKFAKADARPSDRKLDYRGHGGEQVLKPGKGDGKPGGANRPDLGGKGEEPGKRPDIGQIDKGLKERPSKQAALEGKKPDLGKAKPKGQLGGNALDLSDGARAKDFSKRGHASLGDRGSHDFSRPSGGGKSFKGGGGGGKQFGGGGRPGGGHGGGGRGGGGRRR
jgi:hypothetical protein